MIDVGVEFCRMNGLRQLGYLRKIRTSARLHSISALKGVIANKTLIL